MDRTLEIQICSVESESDVESGKLREQYLRGNYTELRAVRTQKKIKRVVGIETSQEIVEATVVEWKPDHIPDSTLFSEFKETYKEIVIEQQYSTVTPHLKSKLHRLEELIFRRF